MQTELKMVIVKADEVSHTDAAKQSPHYVCHYISFSVFENYPFQYPNSRIRVTIRFWGEAFCSVKITEQEGHEALNRLPN